MNQGVMVGTSLTFGLFLAFVVPFALCDNLVPGEPPGTTGLDCGGKWPVYTFPLRNSTTLVADLNFTGNSFAGRAEFPFLVEIRTINSEDFHEQEKWSNGNLVTDTFVLTTCSAVATIGYRVSYSKSVIEKYKKQVVLSYVTKKDPKEWKVLFSDDFTYKTPGSNTGTREIWQFHAHPLCAKWDFDHDWGVVELKGSIYANPPWIGYVNTDFNPEGYNDAVREYCYSEGDPQCVVGLWGRQTVGSYALDTQRNWKLKYRVHPVDPIYCYYVRKSLPDRFQEFALTDTLWTCMGLNENETVAVVCDRDRGAPIVCGGVIRAIVLAGVDELNCNRTQPQPFLVMDFRYAFSMLVELDPRAWKLYDLKNFARIEKPK